MKTRKLLFTMIAAMTMVFGLTLTAHAEETPAPATKVVGVEGIGTFTVPADWTEEYIEGYGTYWFNPTKTACVSVDCSDRSSKGHPPIEAFSATYRNNIEAMGVTIIDWQVTKYFDHDAIYQVVAYPGNSEFPIDCPVYRNNGYDYCYTYYAGDYTVGTGVSATSIEQLQSALLVFATYQPVQ